MADPFVASVSADEAAGSSSPATEPNAEKQLNVAWLASEDFKNFKKIRNRTYVVAIAVLLSGSFLFYRALPGQTTLETRPGWYLAPIGISALVLYFVAAWLGFMRLRDKRYFAERFHLGLVENLQREEELLAEGDHATDFAPLWRLTQKRIDTYHAIATAQAENSFRMGQGATVAGFVAVLVLGGAAAFAREGTAAIAASVVGVAGAAMSAYIGSTFMKAQAEASSQLRQFFLQPVEFSRMLAAERLVGLLNTDEHKAAAVNAIIMSLMSNPQKDQGGPAAGA